MTLSPSACSTFRAALRSAACLMLAAGVFSPAMAQGEDYRVEVGDVVSFDVVGIAGVKRNSAVASDGTIVVPIVGRVRASGRTLDDIRGDVVKRLSDTSFPGERNAQGKESWIAIFPEEVVIDIAEYRPVYLTGDVAVQGRQDFVPGMTVLQSVSAAGGFETVFADIPNPAFESAEVGSEIRDLWSRLAATEARILRLKAEAEGRSSIDFSAMSPVPLPGDMVEGFRRLETDQMTTRLREHQAAKTSVRSTIEQADKRIALLGEKAKSEQAALTADEGEFDRVEGLRKKGLTPVGSSNFARRNVLDSSIQMLQTASEVSLLERERIALSRSLEKLDAERRIEIVSDMQTASENLSDVDAKLRAAREKMRYLAGYQRSSGADRASEPRYAIVRKTAEGSLRISADENDALSPGDVVEVALAEPVADDHEPSRMLTLRVQPPEAADRLPVEEPAAADTGGLDPMSHAPGFIPSPRVRPSGYDGKVAADVRS